MMIGMSVIYMYAVPPSNQIHESRFEVVAPRAGTESFETVRDLHQYIW